MTAHSPTPFGTDGSLIGCHEGGDCPPQSWTLVARIEQGIGNRPADQYDQREANAAFIVAACNEYETLQKLAQEAYHYRALFESLAAQKTDLLAALKALQAGFADGSIRFTRTRQSDTDPYHPANILMCAAIAKAEGVTP